MAEGFYNMMDYFFTLLIALSDGKELEEFSIEAIL
jgi:hypothetical protein